MNAAHDIALAILEGFDKHYALFRHASRQACEYFEQGDWEALREASRLRIDFYDRRVQQAVDVVRTRFPEAQTDDSLWPKVKQAYIALLYDHLQPECAETFYNSVACRVLTRTYYHNQFIFWRPAVSTEHLHGSEPTYRCYYPAPRRMHRTVEKIARDLGLGNPFENLRRDIRCLLRAIRAQFPAPRPERFPSFQVQVLSSPFFRNKVAYVVGRAVNGPNQYPFAVPLRQNERGELYCDALLFEREHVAALFSLARAYFMVDMEVPAAYVSFLRQLMPGKTRAELYTAVGLQKQGKTLFYRDLHQHMSHSTDLFGFAAGTKGMVMIVFTLPSFPYVFKVIRDRALPPKDTSTQLVKEKYFLVKHHDRAGRMADTLEYSDVALPADRFEPAVLDELSRWAASKIEHDGDRVILKHVYIERRLTPLDVYLRKAAEEGDEERTRHAVQEFGDALRDIAAANIFAGDLLPKNFGVTRYGRVVFYDYDEISYLLEVQFRRMPKPRNDDDEYAGEPWFSVGPHDVFPEEFPRFLFGEGRARELFLQLHGELLDAAWWQDQQRRVREGIADETPPYPRELRFDRRRAEMVRVRPRAA